MAGGRHFENRYSSISPAATNRPNFPKFGTQTQILTHGRRKHAQNSEIRKIKMADERRIDNHFLSITQLHIVGAFDKSFRTVLTGVTAICAFVYSCQTGLRSLTGVRLFSQDCPETCQNGR